MSFAVSRASTLALLLSAPLVQALACTSPERDFADGDETGGSSGAATTGGRSGGTGPGSGGANNGGDAGAITGSGGEVQAGTGAGGEPSNAGSGADAGEANGGAGGAGGAGGVADAGAGGSPSGGTTSTGGITGNAGAQGTAGTGTGGIGSGGITGIGGKSGTGGITGSGGIGSGGKAGTGGIGTGGIGSGGKANTGGVTGTGGGGGTCVPTGAEICTDGKDNDCNGKIDCLTFSSVFPDPNGAAPGKDVQLVANAPVLTGYTFQCRSARGAAVADNVPWVACPTGTNTRIVPRTVTESQTATNDGLWTTQVRALFPSGVPSDHFSHTYYMHSSMHIAARCPTRATDNAFITAARSYLNDAGVFGTGTVLRSPFIQLGFSPPVSTLPQMYVPAGSGMVKLASLRRRFMRSADDKFVLMTRNYASSRSNVCHAINLRTHDSSNPGYSESNQYQDDCTAVVFNRAGAGICLYLDANNAIQAVKHNNSYTLSPTYSPSADNFAWRKLLHIKQGGLLHFSRKCFTAGCAATQPGTFYLPDRTQFPYY